MTVPLDEAPRSSAWQHHCQKLSGRNVVVIGGADVRKRSLWESARAHGVRVILVESMWPFPPVVGLGSEIEDVIVIPRLHTDHTDEAEAAHCDEIVRKLAERGLRPDGVTTAWDECTVLAAMVAERLGLRGNPAVAQRRAKSKLGTYRALAERSPELVVPFIDLKTPQDVFSERARSIRYPAVVKWCHGVGALGTFAVASPAEAVDVATRLMALLEDPDAAVRAYPDMCFRFGGGDAGVVLMEFIPGTEHDVDLLLFDGKLIDAVVTDNANLPPSCAETCALMPSALPEAQKEALIAAAYQACRSLGLTDGAVNAELMLSPIGPKVVEINGRMGGVYIAAWMKDIWSFDLPAAVFMIACGLDPIGRADRPQRCHIAGVTCFPGDGSSPDAALGERTRRVMYMETSHGPAEIPYMSVGFRGASRREALAEATARLPALFAGDPGRARVLCQQLAALVTGEPARIDHLEERHA
jgi:carnosine synthase